MHKELVKSKAPRRWMAACLVLLAVFAMALALLWVRSSNAAGQDAASASPTGFVQVMASADEAASWDPTRDLKCEMVRVWPLPSECLFVFQAASNSR